MIYITYNNVEWTLETAKGYISFWKYSKIAAISSNKYESEFFRFVQDAGAPSTAKLTSIRDYPGHPDYPDYGSGYPGAGPQPAHASSSPGGMLSSASAAAAAAAAMQVRN